MKSSLFPFFIALIWARPGFATSLRQSPQSLKERGSKTIGWLRSLRYDLNLPAEIRNQIPGLDGSRAKMEKLSINIGAMPSVLHYDVLKIVAKRPDGDIVSHLWLDIGDFTIWDHYPDAKSRERVRHYIEIVPRTNSTRNGLTDVIDLVQVIDEDGYITAKHHDRYRNGRLHQRRPLIVRRGEKRWFPEFPESFGP